MNTFKFDFKKLLETFAIRSRAFGESLSASKNNSTNLNTIALSALAGSFFIVLTTPAIGGHHEVSSSYVADQQTINSTEPVTSDNNQTKDSLGVSDITSNSQVSSEYSSDTSLNINSSTNTNGDGTAEQSIEIDQVSDGQSQKKTIKKTSKSGNSEVRFSYQLSGDSDSDVNIQERSNGVTIRIRD